MAKGPVRRTFALLALLLGLCACATRGTLPPESSLSTLVDDARMGRIDICRDQRWAAWRFELGEQGRARLAQLRAAAGAFRVSVPDSDSESMITAIEQRQRMYDLVEIIDAVVRSSDLVNWRASFEEGARRMDGWRAKADAIPESGLVTAAERRALWLVAHRRIDSDQRLRGDVVAGVERCLWSTPGNAAGNEFLRQVIAILNEGRWPSDSRDGQGATVATLKLVESLAGSSYLRRNWVRLTSAAAAGSIPSGAFALMSVQLDPDPAPKTTLDAFMQRFDLEWRSSGSFLNSLPAPNSVGDELYRRTLLEQYGRHSMSRIHRTFEKDPEKTAAMGRIWKQIEPLDRNNTARMKELLAARQWFDDEVDGEGAESYGWLIVQHSDLDADFQRSVLARLEPLLAEGRVRPSEYAYLWDRVAVKDKRPQRYGTQVECKDGAWKPLGGVEEPDRLDARRKEMGLGSWNDYIAYFGPCT